LPSGTHPFRKCSLFPSDRGVICHPLNGQMTKIHSLEQSPFWCTAPAQGGDPPIRQVAGRDPLAGEVTQLAGRLRDVGARKDNKGVDNNADVVHTMTG